MTPIEQFASRFGGRISLNPEFVVERRQRLYLLNYRLKAIAKNDFYSAGLYLGKVKNGTFFPSFNILNMLADVAENKVIVNRKAAWLFICGRDLFSKGIIRMHGRERSGDLTLVMNEFNECLGFGRIASNPSGAQDVMVKNVLDLGDFLRREL